MSAARDLLAHSPLTRGLWRSPPADLVRRVQLLTRHLGPVGALRFVVQRRRLLRPTQITPLTLTARGLAAPLACRPTTSDLDVFEQIFVNDDYRPALGMPDVGLIVDCGAYVGYSAAYFLAAYPKARVIAVEPDADNFALLTQNLAPYGDRVRLCHAAIWSAPAVLHGDASPYRDGRHWTRQFRVGKTADSTTVRGIDIAGLLEEHGEPRISILKVDIEGAEALVFGPASSAWLPRVDTIVIELHDDSSFGPATDIVRHACQERFIIRDCGHVALATARPSGRLS